MRSFICIVLALLFIMLSACGEGTPNGGNDLSDSDVTTNENESIEDEIATETVKELPNLPDENLNGYNFRIYTKSPSGYNEWANQDIYVAEETGEPINDAVYARNRHVEEKFNVVISEVPGENMYSNAQKVILAGADDYDAMTPNMYDSASLALADCLVDLRTVENLDLSRIWWDQRANIDLTLNNKLYFTVGDLFIMDNDATWLTIFNKSLIEKYNLESPYDLVRNNNWTFDKYYEMLYSDIAQDLNGDGEMTRDDMYAQVAQGENSTAYFLAAGEHYISKDSKDLPVLTAMTERAVLVTERIFDIMFDRNVTFDYWDLSEAEPFKVTQAMFEANRALFKCTALQLVIRMRTMETEFGIIPMPKFNAAQENYGHYVHPTASAISIPVTATDLARTGMILEALAAESLYTVRPAYYEISMKGKFFRDNESEEMLDIILSSRVFELATMYSTSGLGGLHESFVRSRSREFVSTYTKNEGAYQKAIDKIIETVTE
jgi:Bacterial extracellular solute-binding protein.